MRQGSIGDELEPGLPTGRGLISRRRFLRGLAGAGAALPLAALLAACGGDDDDDDAPTNTPDTGADEPTATKADAENAEEPTAGEDSSGSAGAFPVTIEHAFGSTTIEELPERVVSVDWNGADFALALGVTPVGVREWLGGYPFQTRPWARDEQGGVELETVGGEELDFEQIAALRPDLIIGLYAHLTEEVYTTLSQIAPTIAHPSIETEISWEEQMLLTGRALGQEERAAQIVAGIEAQYEQARAAHPEFDGLTAAFVSFGPDGFWIFEATDVRTQFLTPLGFQLPGQTGQFSHEQAEALDIDAVVAVIPREQFESDPLYGELNAVDEGRVIYLDDWTNDLAAAIGFNSPLSLGYLLDAIVPMLAAAVDGDAATAPEAGGTETDAGEAFPVTIAHMFGDTLIEARPERIVSVGWTEQDALLALGIVPTATTEWFGGHPGAIHPWAQDELGDAPVPEVLNNEDGIDFERIAALRPDVILALYVPFDLTEETYERLSQIAPTVAPPPRTPDGGISWQDLTRTVGIVVGQAEQAEQIVADVEALFAQARTDYPEFVGATGVNAYPTGQGTIQAYPPPDPGGRLLAELGFVVPQEILDAADGAAWVDISTERMDLFDTDVMVWLVDSYDGRDELLADPLYQSLDVATQGRHIFLSYDDTPDLAAATSIQTVLSLPFLLESLVPMLAAAIDGDPETEVLP